MSELTQAEIDKLLDEVALLDNLKCALCGEDLPASAKEKPGKILMHEKCLKKLKKFLGRG